MASGQPQMVSGQPQMASGQPQMVSGQPQMVSGQTQMVSGQPHMASGQGSHWLTESPTTVHLRVTRPSEMFVEFVSKHNHTSCF